MTLTRVLGLTATVLVATQGPLHGQEPSLASVMERAAAYAATFQRQLSNIVAEERYLQDIRRINLAPGRFAPESHRELRSDVLLVRPGGTDRYVEFRDVFEVDGVRIRDRQDRLTALFLDPTASAEAQIQRINRESARYNIGNIERTINTPTLALLVLLPQNQPRFRFTRTTRNAPTIARGGAAATGAWVIEYEEMQRPTLIRTTQGLDLPARGRFWTEPDTGRVLMSELITDDPIVRATIDVSYQWDPLVGLMVPAEMRERYEGRRDGVVIDGNATYGKIRQFQVRSSERLGAAEPSPLERPEPGVSEINLEDVGTNVPIAALAVAQPVAAEPVLRKTAQDQPKPPTFSSSTELVLVDFVVTDKADRPVRGLSARDFVVKEDGRERPIVTFEAFGGAAPARTTPSLPDAATVLLVDDGQLSPQQAARLRPALKGLMATVGGRSGSLMLVAPESRVSVVGQLPAGAAAMSAAVDRIAGQRVEDPSNLPVADAEALAIASGDLPALARVTGRFLTIHPELTADQANIFARERGIDVAHEALVRREAMYDVALQCLDWLAAQPGRHSLIVVSGGFARDPNDANYFEVVTRSQRANAPMHFLDARGLQGIGRYQGVEYGTGLSRDVDEGPFGWYDAASGSTDLADDTGGISVSNVNDMEKGLGRLLDTMTTYYVLAYQAPAHEKAGYRRIRVEIRTKGLTVRARRGYVSR
jgi:VWFA-related protein